MQLLFDFMRVFLMVEVAIAAGSVTWISYRYYKTWRFATRNGMEWQRLLPRHVCQVSGMTVALMIESVTHNVNRIGEPFTFYLPLNLFVFTVILFSLVDIFRYLKSRNHASLAVAHIVGENK